MGVKSVAAGRVGGVTTPRAASLRSAAVSRIGGTAQWPKLSDRLIAIGDQNRLTATNPVQVLAEPRLEFPGAYDQ
jgi:hypothetical protein